jgi:hypothetical protein
MELYYNYLPCRAAFALASGTVFESRAYLNLLLFDFPRRTIRLQLEMGLILFFSRCWVSKESNLSCGDKHA